MKKHNLKIFWSIWIFAICQISFAQITIDAVLQEVISNSFVSKIANTDKAIAQASFQFYQSQLKPNVTLFGNLPNYTKTSSAILQPDGTIEFQPIRQANSALSLFGSQVIQKTGGTIFVNSDIQRFDDFTFDIKQYNGVPLRVGIRQSLFGYNPWKHEKNIQGLLLDEAEKNYNIAIEEALGNATDLYFNILIAKQNLEIAKTNQEVNEKLLIITDERLLLGKVSKDEKLQLEIELNNAKLSVSQATTELDQAIATLYTFIGKDIPSSDTQFEVPTNAASSDLNLDKLLTNFKINRPEIITFQRGKAEAQQALDKAKTDFGFQIDVEASIGLARGSQKVQEIYTDPFDEQQFNVSLAIPILDWGRRKSGLNQIKLREQNLEANYAQQLLELENSVRQNGLVFSRLQYEIILLKEIMKKAEERFEISNQRYILGNIDITNLTIAQREKDQTKRNYINALKSYWVTYYNLRVLSGYDILKDEVIRYE